MRPRIENSDRGITMNKSLAWTVLTALVAGGFWVGSSVTALQSTSGDNKTLSRSNEIRIRSLESSGSRQDAMLSNLVNSIEEMKSNQRETNTLLRKLSAGEKL